MLIANSNMRTQPCTTTHYYAAHLTLVSAVAMAVVPCSGTAQIYPAKPIRVIVAFAPGGGTDILSRVIGQSLQDAWGQPVVIENRPGASGRIGTELVARAAPDGHTLLGTSSGPFVISPTLTKKLSYDVFRDFAPITLAVTYPYTLVTHPSVPARNVPELPTFSEAGVPDFVVSSWFGWFAPGSTPSDIINKLHKEIVRIVHSAEMKPRFISEGADPVGNTPAQFVEHMKSETAEWAKVIKAAGIRAD